MRDGFGFVQGGSNRSDEKGTGYQCILEVQLIRLAVGWKIEVLENKKSGVICRFLHDLSQNKTKLY